ncbi:MAG: hypothetical protein HOD92_24295 [Deltaproteobacteria bacterium]|jgi:glutamate racemase|nr:hypothetical protein [Deltaproteobacteria bacterium]
MKKICITDSGYGGLTVCADLVHLLKKQQKAAEINYFNACYADNYGYNAIPDRKSKVKMFDKALVGIKKYYAPDEILVACNTLSTLIEDTNFVKNNAIPIKSIIDVGLELIQKTLSINDTVSIFGTETTIGENTYLKHLLAKGWGKEQIEQIACPGLQTAISRRDQVEKKVKQFTGLAGKNSWYFLGCTHYGIRSDAFQHSKILNPNLEMAQKSCEEIKDYGTISMKMVSRYEMPENEIATWTALLKEPLTVEMLKNYTIKEDLF